MQYQGVLTKMQTELKNEVQYYLSGENDFIHFNQLIDKFLRIEFIKYQCLACGLNKKIYRQGYCYDDFYKVPQTADWIMRPELSKAHLGEEDRDLAYEEKMQLQPHVVYLANSSSIKVGVTRRSQLPTRWIDQGAHEAIEIVEVPNRYLAGIAEVALKDHIADKTNWRKMLTNDIIDENLMEKRDALKEYLPLEVLPYFIASNSETHINFPVKKYPEKIKSINLEKTPFFEAKLMGIKGQYLIFGDGTVFNVRNHEGFVVGITILSKPL